MTSIKKVFVCGKFDHIHQGHREFLRDAKSLGSELYVIIIPKIHLIADGIKVDNGDEERKRNILNLGCVKKVFITSLRKGDDFSEVINCKPDVFIFGHDQKTKWETKLKRVFKENKIYPEYFTLGMYNKSLHWKDLWEMKKERKQVR